MSDDGPIALRFEFKFASDTNGRWISRAMAAFNNIDDGGDMILPGAFVNTLRAIQGKQMPPMLLKHGGCSASAARLHMICCLSASGTRWARTARA
jgi:hypothetical protein